MQLSSKGSIEEITPMSIASPFGIESPALDVDAQSLRTVAFRPVEMTAFWAAVALPLVYPLLMVGGIDGNEVVLLAVTVALHVTSLRLGRGHRPAE